MKSDIDINFQHLRIHVPADHDRTQPLPLTLRKGDDDTEYQIWATGDGDKVFAAREHAENYIRINTEEYREQSRKRMEASRLVKAAITDGDGNMVTLDGDEYFADVDELIEHFGDDVVVDGEPNVPAWCYATKRAGFDLDLEGLFESYMSDHHHEDAADEIKDIDELMAFWKTWKAKQTVSSFYIDYSRIIVIDQERYQRELDEAKAYLEANQIG